MQAMKCKGGAGSAPPSHEPLEDRISALADLSIPKLKAAWSEAWGVPPPKGARRRFLMLGLAWQWQAQIHGRIAKPLERRLAALEAGRRQTGAVDASDRRTARPRRRLMPGNRLIRIWQGERHEVHVTEGGYLWRGRNWASLSAIAREITGTRRNGPAFFGLRDGEAP